MFLARVLPTVAVLELEIGVGTQFAEAQGDAVVLAEVAITAHACGVFQQDALLLVFPGDDVDDAGDGVAAVEGARRSFHNLYLLDVVRVDERQVVLPAYVAMYALAVDEDENVGVAKAVDLHLRPHVVLVEGKRRRQPSKYVLDASPCIVAKHFRGDDLGLDRGVLQQVLCASTCHHHLLQRVGSPHVVTLRFSSYDCAQCQQSHCQSLFHIRCCFPLPHLPVRAYIHFYMAGLLTLPNLLCLPGFPSSLVGGGKWPVALY